MQFLNAELAKNDAEGGISTFLREVQSEKALDEIIFMVQLIITFSSDEQSENVPGSIININVGVSMLVNERIHCSCQQNEFDSYLSEIIRKQETKEFIVHVNRMNLSLESNIETSIFETNELLMKNNEEIKIIEYAAFYGSNEIFRYMHKNGATMRSNILKTMKSHRKTRMKAFFANRSNAIITMFQGISSII